MAEKRENETTTEFWLRQIKEQARVEAIEECAKAIEPKGPRPCDCEPFGCYCKNYDDAQTVAAWDADMANANRIRALVGGARE
jgi:hypothetical protein